MNFQIFNNYLHVEIITPYTFCKNISKYNILCIILVHLWFQYRKNKNKKIQKKVRARELEPTTLVL